MDILDNIHPGDVLLNEFMKPLEITAYRLSKELGIPQTRISQILKGKRRITADTAIRLSSDSCAIIANDKTVTFCYPAAIDKNEDELVPETIALCAITAVLLEKKDKELIQLLKKDA